jgi:RimJ/RimL family protein N-acetyltransferase
MMATRHTYRLDLTRKTFNRPSIPHLELRAPLDDDVPTLAALMLDAYRGTVDYDGETIAQAQMEVEDFFQGAYGQPLLDCSRLGFIKEALVTACLAAWWGDVPLISFVMTAAAWKNQGLGNAILQEALRLLSEAGHKEVRAVITEGNLPSEKIFAQAGFVRVDPYWGDRERKKEIPWTQTN